MSAEPQALLSGRLTVFELLDAAADFGRWLDEQETKNSVAVTFAGTPATEPSQDDPQKEPTHGQA